MHVQYKNRYHPQRQFDDKSAAYRNAFFFKKKVVANDNDRKPNVFVYAWKRHAKHTHTHMYDAQA